MVQSKLEPQISFQPVSMPSTIYCQKMELEVEDLELRNLNQRADLQSYKIPDESQINVNAADSTHDNPHFNVLLLNFRRTLKVMRVTGTCYGNIELGGNSEGNRSSLWSRFYCVIELLGQWGLAVQALTSLFIEGTSEMTNFYLLLIYSIFYLQCAVVATISVSRFSKRQHESHFTQLTEKLKTDAVAFDGLKIASMTRVLLLAYLFSLVNTIALSLIDFYGNVSIARYRPWNGSFLCRFFNLFFGFFASCSWSFPFVLFCATCEPLAEMFNALKKKAASENSLCLPISSLRKEHQKLCEIVALADDVFAPLLLATFISDIPLISINLHRLVKSPSSSREEITFVLTIIYWCLSVATKVTIILKYAAKVNEKVGLF